MKCPKCGYLGFETSDRCRNCGYDFSLAVSVETHSELPLQAVDGPGAPLADLELGGAGRGAPATPAGGLDLDRIIGGAPPGAATATRTPPAEPRARTPGTTRTGADALPLFPPGEADDTPLITKARPPRAPLSVRRTTPETPRGRPVAPAPRPAFESAGSIADSAVDAENDVTAGAPRTADLGQPAVDARPATRTARLAAALIDLLLVSAIDVAVVYLTLALAGLDRSAIRVLPLLPFVGFFAILNGGYLIAFVAASGQTIGKMIAGIRVMGDDGRRVDVSGAVLRAVGCGISILTAGLAYLPAFVTADGRALHDRIAGTRVVSAR